MALFLVSCNSSLYYPSPHKYVNEKELKPRPQEVYVNSSKNNQLMSWFFQATTPKPITVVFAHGNAQNLSSHFRNVHWLLNKGINYLIIGYPGYGSNKGSPSPRTTVEATTLGINWVHKSRPKDAIFLLGQSLGGNIILRALSEYPKPDIFCGIAIEGSFSSYKKIAQFALAQNGLFWFFQWLPYLVIDDSWAIAGHFNDLPHIPYLIIHGSADNIVPFDMGKKLFNQLPSNKVFWGVDGGKHIDTFFKYPSYRDRFVEFIDRHCLTSE